MIKHTDGAPRPVAAWDNPYWVHPVMHFPDDFALLENIKASGPRQFTNGTESHKNFRKSLKKASIVGWDVGATLAVLYVHERSGIQDPKPSLEVAKHCVKVIGRSGREKLEAMGIDTDDIARVPGRSTLESSLRHMRGVAHLWAARVFRAWEGDMRPLYKSNPNAAPLFSRHGMQVLLATAHDVQQFALRWRDPRNGSGDLLGSNPSWLVPADASPIRIEWPSPLHLPPWLIDALQSWPGSRSTYVSTRPPRA